ncbi:MAG: ABC transporter ATP-binding protein [Marinifilaceae bacterium]|jgi:ABC-2 type transport system ATP-binding protein|nr:ABC transporter ATP-binding protein [Marinifilaceae bacterium]
MDIVIENLSKNYGSQKAVDNISFKVKQGEILGFLGPNGAGKTTCLKMIINYLGADKGEILIGGKSIKTHSAELKKYIGYLPEHNPLYLDMTVIDYLKYYGSLQDVKKSELQDRVKEMIIKCGLDKEKHKKIAELSKGYRQRVGLAQAIIHKPDILILDEPTTGLDPNQIVEIRNLIRELGKDKTVLFSTHILSEVEATCDRILIINNGRIVANGTAQSLRTQASGNRVYKTKILDGEKDSVFNSIHALDSVTDLQIDNGYYIVQSKSDIENATNREIFNLCVKNNWVLSEMIPVETKFEDVFRTLTKN